MPLDLATVDKKLLVATKAKEGKNIITPIGRLSFPNLITAKANSMNKDGPKKFGCSLLIPPTADIKLLKQMAQECAEAEWGNKVKDMKIRNPFLKAEEYKYEGYVPGWMLIRTTAISKPSVVEAKGGALIRIVEDDPEVIYPGRWCQISLNAFAYDNSGNKGISFGLNNVLLLNHDDSLGGRMKAEDEFEAPDGDFGSATSAGENTVDSLF